MAIEYILTSTSTAYDVQTSDDVFVMDGVNITSTTNAIFTDVAGVNNGITVTVRGGLYGTTGINLWSNSTQNNDTYIYLAKGAHVHGTQDGITIRQGDDNVVVNYGEISAQQAGIYFQGGEATVINHGSISSFGESGQGAIIFNATADGDDIREVVNTGIISGAPQITSSVIYATILNAGGAEFRLNNSGLIEGIGADALYSSASLNLLNNSGEINGNLVLRNTTTLSNTGTIFGDVEFGSGDDIYTGIGNGIITGGLALGSGDDTATLGNLGGTVYGDAGNDTLTGGAGADFLDGGDDNDRLYGRGGDDDLRGGLGSDYVSGGMGDDQLIGDDGADKMFGGEGDDTLNGGRDKDTIRGGDGEDEIKGGRLADVLRGGAGADTFVYDIKQDSSTGASDVIQDFEVGIDVIDLTGVASGLTFVGTAAFSGTANEVRYDIAGNGRTYIQVDTDANGSADMRIWLTDVGALSVDDFVL
ncbi:calcium-binding protein [uncultured Pseudosulfitobacter sp.]|jgi:serralysin|uniref:calcium-binding protein n=1 Tax=uncultured Pseudosulfitobacter sp. TaxID=2854214 RepID=UPI0030D78C4B|tara:strand:- start:19001 stop:20425 length:1425 start_codon:yes stop_codon:yes gene_type:complete